MEINEIRLTMEIVLDKPAMEINLNKIRLALKINLIN